MNNIDLYLFNLIHGLAGESTYLDFFARFSAQYLLYFAVSGFFLWAAFTHDEVLKQIRLSVGLLALASGIFARFILAEILRIFLPRPRPFVFFNFPPLVREFATLNSFPSGQVIFFFAFATIVFFHSRKLGGVLFFLGFLIGLSRVYVGVHWPSDILAGAALGVLTGLGVWHFLGRKWISFLES